MKQVVHDITYAVAQVAFTPKGGCPLKPTLGSAGSPCLAGSIHPQGWVLIRVQASDTKSLGQVRSFAPTPLAPS